MMEVIEANGSTRASKIAIYYPNETFTGFLKIYLEEWKCQVSTYTREDLFFSEIAVTNDASPRKQVTDIVICPNDKELLSRITVSLH